MYLQNIVEFLDNNLNIAYINKKYIKENVDNYKMKAAVYANGSSDIGLVIL